MTEPIRRKRYLLLSADRDIDEDAKKELLRVLLQRYPTLDQKKMVWLPRHLILRTDHLTLPEMKQNLVLRSGGVSLTPAIASGSISKLKRAAKHP